MNKPVSEDEKIIAVIAGTRREFENEINRLVTEMVAKFGECEKKFDVSRGLYEVAGVLFLYVDSPKRIRGLRNVDFYCTGNIYERDDIEEIKALARMSLMAQNKEFPEWLR